MTKTKKSKELPMSMFCNLHKDFLQVLEQDMQARANQQQSKFAKAKHNHAQLLFAFFGQRVQAIL